MDARPLQELKRIKEVVGEDGSVVIRVIYQTLNNNLNVQMVHLSTDGYMLIAETKPIKPGECKYRRIQLKLRESFKYDRIHRQKRVNYPNGKEVEFGFQRGRIYTV